MTISQAIFLSYSSQDADTARRVCAVRDRNTRHAFDALRPMRMKAPICLAIGSLACWAGALCAQGSGAAASGNEPPPAKDTPQKIDRVEVKESASNYDARREDTASKIVVTEQEIMKFGDTELAAVLKRLPGLSVQGSDIRMRGLGAGYTQILLDGQRPPPGFAIDQLSPTQVERIEIIRAATADMSTSAIAGTINIVLKKKVSKSSRELRVGYRQGSGYSMATTSFQRADRIDDFSYSINGELFKNRISFPGTGEQSRFDSAGRLTSLFVNSGEYPGTFERMILTPRLNWSLEGGDTLSLNSSLSIGRGRNSPRSFGRQLVGTPLAVIDVAGETERTRSIGKSDLSWVSTTGSGQKLDFKAGGSFANHRRDEAERGFGASGALTQDRLVSLRQRQREFTTSGKLSTLAVDSHAVVIGWDAGWERSGDEETRRDNPTTVSALMVTGLESRHKVSRLAAFAQDEWNLRENWSMYAGVRWEGVNTDIRVESGARAANRYSVWSPLFQTLWKFPDQSGWQLRLALTRTYKAPSAGELSPRLYYIANNNSPIDPDYRGNPALKPELATGIDAAVEKFWEPGSNVSLSASARRIRDNIRNDVVLIGNRWTNLRINDGAATVVSLEFDSKFPLTSIYSSAPPIDFRFNAGINRSRVDKVPGPSNRLASQTPYSATFGMDYRMKGGEFVSGGSFTFKGGGEVRSSRSQFSTERLRRNVELYGLWKATSRTTVRLTMADILREQNVDETRYVDASGSARQVVLSPTRMHVRLNVEMKF